jgi:PTS system nitrogen regulatory IIA component
MYLNVIQVAESFGVEESVIEGWVRDEGMPHVPERGRLLFDRAQVATWAVERGLAAKVGFLAPEGAHAHRGRRIETMLRTGGIWRDVAPAEIPHVLETVVGRLPGATPSVRQLLVQRVRAPGGVIWAPVGGGLALPHLRAPVALGRESGVLALLFLREGLVSDEPAPDGLPVTRLVFFVAPSPRSHLELLAQLSGALTRGPLHRLLLDGAPDEEIFGALDSDDGAAARAEGRGPA